VITFPQPVELSREIMNAMFYMEQHYVEELHIAEAPFQKGKA